MSNESGHWYSQTGKPCHTQPTKSKNAKNPTRPTNITDAKEQGLLPSVSAYIKEWANPDLERHKMREVVKACYNCTPGSGEQLKEYTGHILEKSGEDAGAAADLGTKIHAALETYYKEPLLYNPKTQIQINEMESVDCHVFVEPAIAKVKELGVQIVQSEVVLVNLEHGYAGTADLILTEGILDFKSIRSKPGVEIEPRASHPVQIAAYNHASPVMADIIEQAVGYNVYISTTEIGRVESKFWNPSDMAAAWGAFKCCLELYRYRTGYDPRVKSI